MKLKLTIAVALAGLLYAVVKAYAPQFPISQEQILQIVIVLLGWLGVVIVEDPLRGWLVRRGFNGFE